MLLGLVAFSLLVLLAGLGLPRLAGGPPALWAHTVFALAVLPLIVAAMQHFAPVLARSRGAGIWLSRLPLLVLIAGFSVVAVFAGWLPWTSLAIGASVALLAAWFMMGWMRSLAKRALGGAHPGLNWYIAAVAALAMAMLAIMASIVWPAASAGLRSFHLYLNLYGFVGMTAVGTLQVLMPTAVGRPDPEVSLRLKNDLIWAMAGSVLMALGAATLKPLLWLGVACWLWPVARLAMAWLRYFRPYIFAWHGIAPILFAALIGFAAALIGTVYFDAMPLSIFLPGFLFALVSGAAAQLIPVWMAPREPLTHAPAWCHLGHLGGVRAVLFMTAALLPLLGYRCAGMPAMTALVWFLVLFVIWLWRRS